MKKEELINELALMLMYLTQWTEEPNDEQNFDLPQCGDGKIHKSWKGYDFDAMNMLRDMRYIKLGYGKAPNIFYPDGLDAATALFKKYGLAYTE